MKMLFVSVLIMCSVARGAVLNYQRSGHLKVVIDEALSVLPANYLESSEAKVTIKAVALKSDVLFQGDDLCKINEGVKFGTTKNNNISISARLIQLS